MLPGQAFSARLHPQTRNYQQMILTLDRMGKPRASHLSLPPVLEVGLYIAKKARTCDIDASFIFRNTHAAQDLHRLISSFCEIDASFTFRLPMEAGLASNSVQARLFGFNHAVARLFYLAPFDEEGVE